MHSRRWLFLVCSPRRPLSPTRRPAQAVSNLNTWRSEVGESLVSTTTVSAWNTGCAHHNNYEFVNGKTLTHTETSGNPGYTTDGAAAGLNSVIADSFSFPNATPVASLLPGPTWDGAVFHRAALLDPRLEQIGFDSETTADNGQWWSFDCLYLQGGDATNGQALDNTRTTPGLTLYPSPGNGAYHVPTKFPGNESPDPTAETGVPGGAQLGWLLSVEINGPWAQTNFGYGAAAHGVTATLAPDGTTNTVPVVISECGPSGCGGAGGTSEGSYFRGGLGIFPLQPLAANTVYRVVLTGGTITDFGNAHELPDPRRLPLVLQHRRRLHAELGLRPLDDGRRGAGEPEREHDADRRERRWRESRRRR